ncbi:MAG: dynamin family protein [Metallibacterium scheffleri]|uniref:dynamin family protein n=1 Tax=Metallibacterium scheffleri TaxID=993689 RepID=UPI0026E97CF0|nr:dynamin family protein [Metallibacterium scheffleri]MCK9367034.1 dynamin family protein [Metallibacterium scheffleri]
MLSDNQRRHLVQSLAHIEQTLTDALLLGAQARGDEVFPRYRTTLSAADVAALQAALRRLRGSLRRFLRAQGIATPRHGELDPRWALDTQITLLRNVALELRPAHLAGFGTLDDDDATACRALAAEIGALLEGMQDGLRVPDALVQTAPGDTLGALLLELVQRYRLGEYRARVAALAARSGRVEVAVVGRVSSGKSSLLNALIERALLPVGVVPVTAVTTRLLADAEPALELDYLDGRREQRPLDELAQHISEQGNPGNRERLAEVRVGLGALPWAAQAVFTDTPGLGALQSHARAAALDYLPRSDLGLLLIDASATLTELERDPAQAVLDSGATLRVLLTKSDLVDSDAVREQSTYLASQLGAALDTAVPIDALSSVPARRDELRAWRERELQPLLASLHVDAAARQRTRALVLGRQILASLRLAAREQDVGNTATLDSTPLLALETATRTQHHAIAEFSERAPAALLRHAAQARMNAAALGALAADIAHQLAQQTRAALAPDASDDSAALPTFDWQPTPLPAPPARALGALGRAWQQQRLRSMFSPALEQTCRAYAAALHAWLDAHVAAHQRLLRAGQSAGAADPAQLAQDIARLAATLGSGPATAS